MFDNCVEVGFAPVGISTLAHVGFNLSIGFSVIFY